MRKLQTRFYDEAVRNGSRRTVRSFLVLALGLLLCPIVYEGALLCTANWRSIWGLSMHVETPILDAARNVGRSVTLAANKQAAALFNRLPWQPSLVITLGVLWAVFMSLPLRRRS